MLCLEMGSTLLGFGPGHLHQAFQSSTPGIDKSVTLSGKEGFNLVVP